MREGIDTALSLSSALKQSANYVAAQVSQVVPNFDIKYSSALLSRDNRYIIICVSSEKDIVLKKKVGQGAYGAVYLAEIYHGYPVACKIIRDGLDATNVNKILEEIVLLRSILFVAL